MTISGSETGTESGAERGAPDDWRRTHTCGELRADHIGGKVVLNGWVHARRDHGGIYFVDLRDRYGLTQIVLSEKVLGELRPSPEMVLSVHGEVVPRGKDNVNPRMPTGEIEVVVSEVELLAPGRVPPFEIEDELDTAIEIRLRHRYLDLRRPIMQQGLLHRSRFIGAMRNAFLRREFVEVETPILTKATPEGARDYLMPSRVQPGNFYALPQSPQIFKQLLMVAGMDRYFQVARCFRDEDLRADRQPEFTQLDMEMSFVSEEDVFDVWEGVLAETFSEAMGVELPRPFARMRWREAMDLYGVDKPDLRNPLVLCDVGEWAASCDFTVFKSVMESGGRVMGLRVPGGASLSRKEVEGFETFAKAAGAKGLAWWKPNAEGGIGPLARFTPGESGARLAERMQAVEGDLCVFVADTERVTLRALGELRIQFAKRLELSRGGFEFAWVTHFPLLEWDEESRRWFSAHHPFTAPEDWELGGKPRELASRAYDLVLNGWELGSGSIRIHRADVQRKVFDLLGIGTEEQEQKFGFLLEALSYGAPPHGGFALGLDRTVALTLGHDSIRDVIAFPKTASASDLMCSAPSAVPEAQLTEVHIRSLAVPGGSGGSAPAGSAAPAGTPRAGAGSGPVA
jgi:aspartyl-tRNA synthetase